MGYKETRAFSLPRKWIDNVIKAWHRSEFLVVVLWMFLAVSLTFSLLENLGFSQRKSYAEIAEGFAAAVVLLLLYRSKPRLSRAMPPVASAFARSVTVSENVRKTALAIFITGALVFSFQVFVDWAWRIPSLHGFSAYMVSSLDFAPLAAASATLGLAICRLGEGMTSAFKQALRTFTLPAILILMAGLLVFGQAYQMPNHVSYFATWSLDGVYLVSNYFVLIVAVSLETMLLSW